VLVSTTGAIFDGVQSILGAPAPGNNGVADAMSRVSITLIEPRVGPNLNPNRVRITTPNDRLEFRRRITNTSAAPISALRLRFVELTTLNSPGYAPGTTQSDLRPNTSSSVVLGVPTSIGVASLTGATLTTPPAQPLGGGWNAVLTIPGGPLAVGASIDINVALRVSRVGSYRFLATVESQP
ncbi:MAG: hypothetical protein K1Y01_09090, partial [Vicinamibacteria bacterium]|nr:hypothetical protein [Vicinamibacteria bacterium]